MANTIRLRRGSTVPSAAAFQVGEPAWDATNSQLYIKNTAGSMVLINPGNQDYGLITGSVDIQNDYGSLV